MNLLDVMSKILSLSILSTKMGFGDVMVTSFPYEKWDESSPELGINIDETLQEKT